MFYIYLYLKIYNITNSRCPDICPDVCPVPTSTRPHSGRGWQVHYTHTAAGASHDRRRPYYLSRAIGNSRSGIPDGLGSLVPDEWE